MVCAGNVEKAPYGGAPRMSEEQTPALDASVIDGLRALEAGGASGLLARVARKFLDSAAGLSGQIRSGIEAGDPAAVGAAAHTLKSSSAQVGALKVSEVAKKLEELGRSGTLDGVPDLMVRLADELEAANGALSSFGE